MPIYEYVCDSCGYDFERIQSFSDDALSDCPRCGEAVRRVISPVGIIFKGSGWYITDSKRQLGSQTSSRGRRQLAKDSDGAGEDGAGKDSADTSGAEDSSASKSDGSTESASKPEKSEAGKSSSNKKPASNSGDS